MIIIYEILYLSMKYVIHRCPRCKSFDTQPANHASMVTFFLSVITMYLWKPIGVAFFFLSIMLFIANYDKRICSDCHLIYNIKN